MILQDIFQGRQFVLDLPIITSYKEKQLLKEKITSNNGIISYIVTRKTDYLIRDAGSDNSSSRTHVAQKYGVKIVTRDFVDTCLEKGKLVDSKLYCVGGVGNGVNNQFADGKIVTIVDTVPKCRGTKLSLIKTWLYKDRDGPTFHTDPHAVVKAVVLKGKGKQLSYPFCVIEIHCNFKNESEQDLRYCVFTHQGMLPVDVKYFGIKTCRFMKTSTEALHVFDQLYKFYSYPPHSMTCCKTLPIQKGFGSDCFHVEDWLLASVLVEAKVAQFVADIWTEAAYVIDSTLAIPLKNIHENQLVDAERLLLNISKALTNNDIDMVDNLSKEFKATMPHRHQSSVNKLGLLTYEYNLCQLVRDLIFLQESISLLEQNIIQQQYFSMHCDIQVLENGSSEYKEVVALIHDSKQELNLSICNIFRVHRSCESVDFTYGIGNKKLLFHGIKAENVVGILSRGMLLSKVFFPHCTGVLGAGLYFTNEFTAANKHAFASKTNGKRLVLMNEVALGECYDTYSSNQLFTRPPDGCNSVHGVKRRKPDIDSDFEHDEYVVYNINQQRLNYVVEFCQPTDTPTVEQRPPTVKPDILHVDPCVILAEAKKSTAEEQCMSTFDLQQFLIKHNSDSTLTAVGLQSQHNEPIPLKSVHIRAKLIDLAAEVIIMQEYHNDSATTIEARYVFPLDDKAAVCGFEAFSNGQHFVGRIEEKRKAQNEYKKAVKSGKRAYLMDEEAPEVFKVSIGNVQPRSIVLVKIRYVAELDLDDELISFRLPGAVSPWQQEQGLKSHLQTSTKLVDVSEIESIIDTSVELFVDMPFDIKTLYSPTHPIQTKKTAAHAVVTMDKNATLHTGFQLLIGLSEIHVPRMWVENHPDSNSSACMITFYPEFMSDTKQDVEVILALDASNSMAGPAFSAAQQIAILCLHYLPPETKFNVLVFGSVYRAVFPSTRQKSVEEMYEAQQFILQSRPTLGSSKITHFSQSYFHLKPPANTLRSIYIISDGHLQEIEPVLQNAANHNSHTRIFCLGVGNLVNTHLLNNLSHVGAGCYEYFDEKRKSKWSSKAQGQMLKAEEPVLTDIKIEWQQFNESETEIIQAPKQITAVFSGSRLTVYGFVNNCSLAVLKGNVGGTEVSTMVFTTELGKSTGTTLHRLTTKALVRDWEKGFLDQNSVFHEACRRSFQSKIIGLSKQYGIITPLTSFVAIEDKDNKSVTGYNGQPTIEEFVQAECIDFLHYIPFQTQSSEESESQFGGGAEWHTKVTELSGGPRSPVDKYYSGESQEILETESVTSDKLESSSFAKVDEVFKIMTQNCCHILERDMKLCELEDRADALSCGVSIYEAQASASRSSAKVIFNKMKECSLGLASKLLTCLPVMSCSRLLARGVPLTVSNSRSETLVERDSQINEYISKPDSSNFKMSSCILEKNLKGKKRLDERFLTENAENDCRNAEMMCSRAPILLMGSAHKKQTTSGKEQFKISSVSLGAGLPFFSSLFKHLISDIGLIRLQPLKEQIKDMLDCYTDELCFPVLNNCDSEGGVQLTNLPQGWNHELWSKIQFQLVNNGLMSMGITVHNSILSLVATVAVLLDICQKISSHLFPLDLTNPSSIEKVASKITEQFHGVQINFTTKLYFIKSLLFVISINQRHPLVYHTLELGNSWEEAVYLLTNGESLLEHDVQ